MSKRQRRKREKVRRHEARELPDRLGRQIATGASVTVGATLLMGGVAHAACTCAVDSLQDPTDTGKTTGRHANNTCLAGAAAAVPEEEMQEEEAQALGGVGQEEEVQEEKEEVSRRQLL